MSVHKENETNEQTAMRVSKVNMIYEVSLTIFKMIAGVVGHSGAMISDAIHSASDVLSTVVVIVGVKLGGKEADKKHPYGHERLESIAAFLLAILLLATGVFIGYCGLKMIVTGSYRNILVPEKIALIAAVVSIVVKETLYWYIRGYAKRIHSTVLLADAWHHRSDALSSIGSLIGIGGARRGILILEPIASIIISLFVIKIAISICQEAIGEIVDECCSEDLESKIKQLTRQQVGVIGIEEIKTRKFGNKVYVDIEIIVKRGIAVEIANQISDRLHDAVEEKFPSVKHIMVRAVPENISECIKDEDCNS